MVSVGELVDPVMTEPDPVTPSTRGVEPLYHWNVMGRNPLTPAVRIAVVVALFVTLCGCGETTGGVWGGLKVVKVSLRSSRANPWSLLGSLRSNQRKNISSPGRRVTLANTTP